jgi:hypothetical protein
MKNSVESLLEDDHESLSQLVIKLESALKTRNAALSFEFLDLFWARLAVHIRAEHLHLFPTLVNVPPSLLTGKDGRPSAEEVQQLILVNAFSTN